MSATNEGLHCSDCGARAGDVADTSDGPVACPEVTRCASCGWGVCEVCAVRDHECCVWSAEQTRALNEMHAIDMYMDRKRGVN